jgi:hypothetical protein
MFRTSLDILDSQYIFNASKAINSLGECKADYNFTRKP